MELACQRSNFSPAYIFCSKRRRTDTLCPGQKSEEIDWRYALAGPGTANEIAKPVLFLPSYDASYVNGIELSGDDQASVPTGSAV
jgi:hypothetical protein